MTVTAQPDSRSSHDVPLTEALTGFLREQWAPDAAVTGLRRLAGGTAHETWAFDLYAPSRERTERLVLRRDVAQGMLDGDLAAEFELLNALHLAGVAVPRPWWSGGPGGPLERPFMIVGRVSGTDIRKYLAAHPHSDRRRFGHDLVRLQRRLHEVGTTGSDLPESLPRRGADGELAEWSRVIEDSGVDPGPLLRAGMTWLRGHVPTHGEWALVHGDFKTNNLLVGADGQVSVLDWEMAHLGDPLEDLAWTMLWTTRFDLVGGLLEAEDYLAAYESESGRPVDPARLLFWRVLALVKLAAIFMTGLARGGQTRPTQHLMGRGLHHIEAELARQLQATLPVGGSR